LRGNKPNEWRKPGKIRSTTSDNNQHWEKRKIFFAIGKPKDGVLLGGPKKAKAIGIRQRKRANLTINGKDSGGKEG